jgi:hypothetical protein
MRWCVWSISAAMAGHRRVRWADRPWRSGAGHAPPRHVLRRSAAAGRGLDSIPSTFGSSARRIALSLPGTTAPNNHLLASLSPSATALLSTHLERGELTVDQILHHAGTVLRHVRLPITAVVSLVSSMCQGHSRRQSGRGEGVPPMGSGMALSRAVVQRLGPTGQMRFGHRANDRYAAPDPAPCRQMALVSEIHCRQRPARAFPPSH